jgi:NTE family protein
VKVVVTFDADLVLEGGGVKGIGLVGTYCALKEAGYRFHRIAGTSAGSIVGALAAADMPTDELIQVMRTVDYLKFEDESFLDHLGTLGKIGSLLFEKGIYEGKYLKAWLDGLLTKLGKRTFGDLKITDDPGSSLPPERSYRLVVMTSDICQGRLVRLPWEYPTYGLAPDDQLVADAVRMSMSIPFFYEPVKLDWKDQQGKQMTSYFIDGGMLSNYPIDVFDRTDGKAPRWPTFGVKLSSIESTIAPEQFDVHDTLGLARAMVGTMASFYDRMHINDPCTQKRTMFVDTFGVKATDFDIDPPTQDRLYKSGESSATAFLSGWNFDRYKDECESQN